MGCFFSEALEKMKSNENQNTHAKAAFIYCKKKKIVSSIIWLIPILVSSNHKPEVIFVTKEYQWRLAGGATVKNYPQS